MNRDQLLAWVLRLVGVVEMLAFVSVVMPRSWMEASHRWLGMGELTGGPVLMFMIRQASYVYGMHGVFLWLLASNVERYRPLIVFTGFSFLLAAPVFLVIDHWSGLPVWWTLSDVAGCAFIGTAVLWLNRGKLRIRD